MERLPVDQGDEKEDDGVAKQLLPEQFPQGALPPAPVESQDFPKQANMCCSWIFLFEWQEARLACLSHSKRGSVTSCSRTSSTSSANSIGMRKLFPTHLRFLWYIIIETSLNQPAHDSALAHPHQELWAGAAHLSRPRAPPHRPPLLHHLWPGLQTVQEDSIHRISTPGSSKASSAIPPPSNLNPGHVWKLSQINIQTCHKFKNNFFGEEPSKSFKLLCFPQKFLRISLSRIQLFAVKVVQVYNWHF